MPHSSGPSATPLHLVLEPSQSFRRAIVLVHALAAAAALLNSLPLGLRLSLAAAVLASLWHTLDRQIRNPPIRGLSLHPDGQWEIIRRTGTVAAVLSAGTVATPWIVILHLATDAGLVAIPILRDSVDPESFRRLRVHVRIQGTRAAAA